MARISRALRQSVAARFEHRCAYCHSPEFLTRMVYEIDHIFPRGRGGRTELDNLAYACPLCNRKKGDYTDAIDPSTEMRVPLFHPLLQTWERHFAWSSDGLRIEGRSPMGRATINALQLNGDLLAGLRYIWQIAGSRPPDWPFPGPQE